MSVSGSVGSVRTDPVDLATPTTRKAAPTGLAEYALGSRSCACAAGAHIRSATTNPMGATVGRSRRGSVSPGEGDIHGSLTGVLEDCLHRPLLHRAFEGGVVPLVLVGVGHCKSHDGLVEDVALAHVPAESGRVPGPGMREGEGPSAPSGVDVHLGLAESLHPDAQLHVPQLADEEVPLRTLAPPEEHVTGGLHAPVAIHDALATVRKHALASIWFEHGRPRLLDLQEQGVALARHEEKDPA